MRKPILSPDVFEYHENTNDFMINTVFYSALLILFVGGIVGGGFLWIGSLKGPEFLFCIAITIICFISFIIFLVFGYKIRIDKRFLKNLKKILQKRTTLNEILEIHKEYKSYSQNIERANKILHNLIEDINLWEQKKVLDFKLPELLEVLKLVNRIRSNFYLYLRDGYRDIEGAQYYAQNINKILVENFRTEYNQFHEKFYDLCDKIYDLELSNKEQAQVLNLLKQLDADYFNSKLSLNSDATVIFHVPLRSYQYKRINELLEKRIQLSFYEQLETHLSETIFNPFTFINLFKHYEFFSKSFTLEDEKELSEIHKQLNQSNDKNEYERVVGIYCSKLNMISGIKLKYIPQREIFTTMTFEKLYQRIVTEAEKKLSGRVQDEVDRLKSEKYQEIVEINSSNQQKLLDLENENQMLKKKLQNYEDIDNERLQLKIEVSELKSQLDTYEGQGVPLN